jgi:O-antigen/teichoic acid export membrane protein
MLVSNTLRYVFARGGPGLANFVALAVFTRLLGPDGYGSYALVIATVGLGYAVLYQWLSLATIRFAQSPQADRSAVLAAVRRWYLRVSAAVAFVVAGAFAVGLPSVPRATIALGGALLLAQAWLEINLMLAAADRTPGRYGLLAGLRAVLALGLGAVAATSGFGFNGVLAAAVVGFAVPGVWAAAVGWRSAPLANPARMDRALFGYGAPLVGTFLLDFFVSTSDRMMIGAMHGAAAAGTYAAAYDLTQQSLWTLMMITNLAAYPLLVAAAEDPNRAALASFGRRHLGLLLAVGVPTAAGLAVLAPGISTAVFGDRFSVAAAGVLPIVAGAILLGGIKAYYFDLAFQIARSTRGQLAVAAVAGLVNVGLNVAWIPRWGGLGAAWATFCAYAVGLGLSVALGRRALRLPVSWSDLTRIGVAAAGMVAVLWPFRGLTGAGILALQIGAGGLLVGGFLWMTNPVDLRSQARHWWQSRRMAER